MHIRSRALILVGVCLVASGTVRPTAGAGRGQESTPSMTNASVEAAPEPLPADWPAKSGDAQLRGSACDSAYGKDGARQYGEAGDDVLPVVGTTTANALSAFRAVRHTPFLARRDVERAELADAGDESGRYAVRLTLTPEGVAKVTEFANANPGKCMALVAGGKVVWTATVMTAPETQELLLTGGFSGSMGIAIVDLFGR